MPVDDQNLQNGQRNLLIDAPLAAPVNMPAYASSDNYYKFQSKTIWHIAAIRVAKMGWSAKFYVYGHANSRWGNEKSTFFHNVRHQFI